MKQPIALSIMAFALLALMACEKDQPPAPQKNTMQVNAGTDETLVLPLNETQLSGSVLIPEIAV